MSIELLLNFTNNLIATTPLVFAGIGELVTEKSGVLNLGVEGMMLLELLQLYYFSNYRSYFSFFYLNFIRHCYVWIIRNISIIFNV